MARLLRLLTVLVAGSALTLPLIAGPPAGAVTIPTVVAVRAAHHPGYDRLVLQFSGGLPTTVHAAWKTQILHPQTGLPVPIAGHAFAEVSATPAQGHSSSGHVTLARRITFALPNLTELVVTEDFEAHVTVALGLQRHTSLHVFRLTSPSRLVIDVGTTWPTVAVRDYFMYVPNFAVGRLPYVRAVTRPVQAPLLARRALERLFAGPTPAEKAAGLRFVASGATGFSSLTISGGIARVRLTGVCSSGGSTFTVADQITPTLKQFASVRWVKVYDRSGHTERPTGQVDSFPACLEP
jgi:hypothetical protein